MSITGPWELNYFQAYLKKKYHEENKEVYTATIWSPGQDNWLSFLCLEHYNKKWISHALVLSTWILREMSLALVMYLLRNLSVSP